MLDRVAARVIEQHDIYSVPMLERFVEQNYPFVSEEQRRALVIAATTGARQAARLYYMVREYESSDSAVRRQSAANAKDVLCSWNFSPRQLADTSRPSKPDVAAVASPESAQPSQEAPTFTLLTTDPLTLQLPVSFEACRAEFDMVTAAIVSAGIQPDASAGQPAATTTSVTAAPEATATVTASTVNGHLVAVSPYVPSGTATSAAEVAYVPTPARQLMSRRMTQSDRDSPTRRDTSESPPPPPPPSTPRDKRSDQSGRRRRSPSRRSSPGRTRADTMRISPRRSPPDRLTLSGRDLLEYRRMIGGRR